MQLYETLTPEQKEHWANLTPSELGLLTRAYEID